MSAIAARLAQKYKKKRGNTWTKFNKGGTMIDQRHSGSTHISTMLDPHMDHPSNQETTTSDFTGVIDPENVVFSACYARLDWLVTSATLYHPLPHSIPQASFTHEF